MKPSLKIIPGDKPTMGAHKPTDPKIMANTIGREYKQPELRAPYFKPELVPNEPERLLQKRIDETHKEVGLNWVRKFFVRVAK